MPEKSHQGISSDSNSGKQSRSGGKLFLRVILPTGLFIVAVGVIAVGMQSLPGWRAQKTAAKRPKDGLDSSRPLFRFFYGQMALWNNEDLSRAEDPKSKIPPVLEMERSERGYFDFAFENTSSVPAILGLYNKECDCSEVKVCLLSPEKAKNHTREQLRRSDWTNAPNEPSFVWHELEKNATEGITVPPGQGGLLRLSWQVRKEEGKALLLRMYLWTQPEGQVRSRNVMPIVATVVVTHAVLCEPSRLPIGLLGPGKSKTVRFFCWSSTRDQFDLEFPADNEGPNIQCSAKKLTPEECRKEEKKLLSQGRRTRIRSAYEVSVAVHEEKDGKQMDTGAILRQVPMRVTVDGAPIPVKSPLIAGLVASPVQIGGGGRHSITLGFYSARNGKIKTEVVSVPEGYSLNYLKHEPPNLRVKLSDPETKDNRTRYEITLTVPKSNQVVPLPSDAVILLQVTQPDGKLRRIRIPVSGTVTAS